jgi:hypothetical protein
MLFLTLVKLFVTRGQNFRPVFFRLYVHTLKGLESRSVGQPVRLIGVGLSDQSTDLNRCSPAVKVLGLRLEKIEG